MEKLNERLSNEEILKRMPKSWHLIRNIWIKKVGSSYPAQIGDNQYASGSKK